MKAFSYFTHHRDGQLAYVGVIFVEGLHANGYASGRRWTVYSDDPYTPPSDSFDRVGKGSHNFIELWHLEEEGQLVIDDGRELESLPALTL